MIKILIIGANSISSRYLHSLIKGSDKEFYFCDLTDPYDNNLANKWFKADLLNFENVFKIIEEVSPDQIYNFAGSFSNDYNVDYNVNVLLPKNILDSIINLKINTRVLLIGSAAEYGIINEKDNPIKEDYKLNPVSIYGLTKVFQAKKNIMKIKFADII